MRLYSYDRTSVFDAHKVSNSAQFKAVLKKASDYGLSPIRFSDKGQSGGSMDRPGVQSLLKAITSSDEPGVLLTWRYDRISRNVNEALEFQDTCQAHNIEVVSISEPLPDGTTSLAMKKMFIQLLYINASMQRTMIIDNVRAGIAYKRSKGKYLSSSVPFGYQLEEGNLVQDVVNAKTVKKIFHLYISEKYGYQKIADKLNDEGLSFNGKSFKKHTIRMILTNPCYMGQIKGGSFGRYQGTFETIITPETFEKAQNIRKSHQKKKGDNQRYYPLKQKLQCPVCGWRLSNRWSKSSSGGNTNHYYYCANRDCNGVMIRAEKIEEEVLALLRKLTSQQTIYAAIQRELLSQVRSVNKSQQKQQKNFEAERKVILQKFEEGVITLEEMKAELAFLKREEQPEARGYNNKEEITKDLQQLLKLTKAPIKELFFEQVELVQVNRSKEITGLYLHGIKQNILERAWANASK